MIDYHIHTQRSHDGHGSVLETCRAAIDVGLAEICFTEHYDTDPDDPNYGYFDYELYSRQIEEAQAECIGRIEVRMGVEVDFQVQFTDDIRRFLGERQFDYAIGSVHCVHGIPMSDGDKLFDGRCIEDVYPPYFEAVLAAAKTGLFDCIAHLDICKRYGISHYGPFDPMPMAGIIDDALAEIIDKKTTLEINTSGLRESSGDTHPCRTILERYRALGGERITIGSDSHQPEHVGTGVAEAQQMARALGFREIDTYRARRRAGKAL